MTDVLITFDYDTVFTAKTVEALLTLMMFSGVDAIAPLQTKREANTVMFALPGVKPEDKTTVENDWFQKPVQLVETAHFGCTFIRTEALRKTPKPWFIAEASERGDYRGGHVDEDIHFWKSFHKAGNKLGIATQVSVGRSEPLPAWNTFCLATNWWTRHEARETPTVAQAAPADVIDVDVLSNADRRK
jgi:hypothetical protein